MTTNADIPDDRAWKLTSRDCVDFGRLHTPVPVAYIEKSIDADDRLARGERQEKCPACGRWAIWKTINGDRAEGSS